MIVLISFLISRAEVGIESLCDVDAVAIANCLGAIDMEFLKNVDLTELDFTGWKKGKQVREVVDFFFFFFFFFFLKTDHHKLDCVFQSHLIFARHGDCDLSLARREKGDFFFFFFSPCGRFFFPLFFSCLLFLLHGRCWWRS
jgi:hypothetical protein